MRLLSIAFAFLLPLGAFAQSRYSYMECADKYRARYPSAEELDKFCYARIACSGEKGMGRAGCAASLTKTSKLFECVQAKKSACTTGLCLEDSIYSCAHRCPEGSTVAGNRCSSGAGPLPIVFVEPTAATSNRAPASTSQ